MEMKLQMIKGVNKVKQLKLTKVISSVLITASLFVLNLIDANAAWINIPLILTASSKLSSNFSITTYPKLPLLINPNLLVNLV